MSYSNPQDINLIGAGGELTADEEIRVQEIQALPDSSANEALGKSGGSVVQKDITENTAFAHNILSATHDANASTPNLGDLIYGDVGSVWTKLTRNTTSTKKFLTQTGTGSDSNAPAWNTLVVGDLPSMTSAEFATRISNETGSGLLVFATSPTFIGTLDGWIGANETWTYASATTITVPSGAASKYKKGDKIKLTQTTVKYFYIIGVADTVLTVTGGTDYTVANAAISANFYSHAENPIGFPDQFNIGLPTIFGVDDGSGGQPTLKRAAFKIINGMVEAILSISGTKAGTDGDTGFTTNGFPAFTSAIGTGVTVLGPAHCVTTVHIFGVTVWNNDANAVYGLFPSINDNTTIGSYSLRFSYEI